MKQAIVILIKNRKIESIRKKYEPSSKFTKPHITIAFPFENVNQLELNKSINNSISRIKKFNLSLEGIRKSPREYYLYLLVKQGKKEILKIHKRLYYKLLKKWLRKDILYIPHITLGIFKTRKQIDNVVKELKKQRLKFKIKVNKIELITLDKNSSIKNKKSFLLK
jgi:2'-5' RNA ligase